MLKVHYIFVIFISAILANIGFAQTVTLSDSVVNFGSVSCYQQHSAQLTLTNNLSSPVQILAADFEEAEFSTDLGLIEIASQAQHTFQIFFESIQNINYTDFLRISLDGGERPLIVEVSAQGVYENSYYETTQNLWGADLKSALHNIIDDHTEYPYTSSSPDVWDILKNTDEDLNNPDNVILLYTGWSYKKSDQNTGDQNGWNREHTWAKSHADFGNNPPAGTDAHHLRPTDVTVNGARGSLDFDTGGSLYTDDDGVTGCYFDSDSWEPRDTEKGDVARMMYYMVVRYEGDDTSYDLELVDYIPSSPSEQPLFGKQSTLYQWHQTDEVSDWEQRRNDRIYSNWQHNRNPFIDYPGFASRLPSISGVDLTEAPEIVVAPVNVDMGQIAFTTSAQYGIALINTGNQDLNIQSITSDDARFSLDKSSLILTPETYAYLNVSFTSEATEGFFDATISLQSNDPDESSVDIPVTIEVKNSTSVLDEPQSPGNFALYQNYPNPFNPKTVISYQLPAISRVKLLVYNVIGQKVKTLEDQKQEAGQYSISLDAVNLPSGIYYYRLTALQAGSTSAVYSSTRKMIIMR